MHVPPSTHTSWSFECLEMACQFGFVFITDTWALKLGIFSYLLVNLLHLPLMLVDLMEVDLKNFVNFLEL